MRLVRTVFLVVVPALLSACDGSSTLEIRLRASPDDSTGLAGIRLAIRGRTITASDFGPDEAGLTEVRLSVPNSGRLEIGVRLVQSGQVAVDGTVSWEMEPEWEWGMDVFRTASDPTETCIGCSGSARLPLAAWAAQEPGESLWLAWGGKPIGSDIVF